MQKFIVKKSDTVKAWLRDERGIQVAYLMGSYANVPDLRKAILLKVPSSFTGKRLELSILNLSSDKVKEFNIRYNVN